MSERYFGGIISKTPITPSGAYETSTASGIWTLEQQLYWNNLGQWPTAGTQVPDAQFNYVTMLLHGNGTNGTQNNTFVDSSTNNLTITRNGNTTQGSFTPYGSGWSMYGASSAAITADFWPSGSLVGTGGSFSTEFFFLGQTNSAGWMLGMTADNSPSGFQKMGPGVAFDGTGNIAVYLINAGGTTAYQSSATAYLAGQWNHLAIVRTGGTLAWWLNGTRIASVSNSTNIDAYRGALGGIYVDNPTRDGMSNCYISNFRASNSVAYYSPSSSSITVPTTSFTAASGTTIITCQSNRFIDTSGSGTTISIAGSPVIERLNPFGVNGNSSIYSTSVTGGSGYFDGTTDYLTTPMSTPLTLGAGDFTIECWLYGTFVGDQRPLSCLEATLNYFIYAVYLSGTELRFYAGDGTSYAIQMTAAGAMKPSAWNHVAVVRSGSTATMYVNGVSVATDASASVTLPAAGTALWFGGEAYGGGFNFFNGYMTDARIVKGTAVYTAAFTPPTVPLTAIANTSILLNYTNGAIFDNAMMNDLETIGNAQISTSVKKFGTGSLAFDGDGDWLRAPNSPEFDMGSGNFTIEGWFYQTGTGGQICAKYEAGNQASWAIGFDGSNWDVYTYYSTASNLAIYTGVAGPTLNTWHHFALERNGANIEFYLNGSRVAQVAAQTMRTTTSGVAVGNLGTGYSSFFSGYIDDLRITKGYARYSGATYTIPTVTFSNSGPN